MTSLPALVLALLVSGETLRTEVVFLQGMQADRAITLWERVLGPSPEATIIPGRSPDVVVVRDTPARLSRFRDLLAALAGAGASDRIYVRPVVHLTPSELAQRLSELIDQTRDAEVALVPDDRSQRLVVRTTPARYLAIDKLARALDVPPHGGRRRVIGVEPEPAGGLPK